LNEDLSKALKGTKYDISSYKKYVFDYKNCKDRDAKKELQFIIDSIKNDLKTEITNKDPKLLKFNTLNGELNILKNQLSLFEIDKKEEKRRNERRVKLEKEVVTLKTEMEDIKNNVIYKNAFEWRFEFPEVLNNDGDFIGFDVVIGNPPYVQLQSMKEMSKQYEKLNFHTYTSMGDLYALFYERGHQLLREEGILSFITGSAWMRANYGQVLRKFFIDKTSLLELIDFSDCEIFDNATVLTNILTFNKSEKKQPVKAIRFTRKDQDKLILLKDSFKNGYVEVDSFPENSWIISTKDAYSIKTKIEAQGTKIKDWGLKINRGILTGLNEAFVISSDIKDQILKEDPNSVEIIKPLLRGRDVKKYDYENPDLWLIATFPSRKINIDEFPGVKKYLESFGKSLEQTGEKGSRKKTSGKWFETQDSISYWEDFEKPKIIYPNMTKFLPFTLDRKNFYTNQKCFLITGENLEFLVSILNSKLFKYTFQDYFPELQGNTRELNKVIFEQLPIKKISEKEQKPFIKLVNQILDLKQTNPKADTLSLENELNNLVYKLYDLENEEIQIIENEIKD
jgi:hypothetical protein